MGHREFNAREGITSAPDRFRAGPGKPCDRKPRADIFLLLTVAMKIVITPGKFQPELNWNFSDFLARD